MHDLGLIRGHISKNLKSTFSGREGENVEVDRDKWIGRSGTNGLPINKAIYNNTLLMSVGMQEEMDKGWKTLWRLQATPKIKLFV